MATIYPPNKVPFPAIDTTYVFLAGSIEMGTAPDWQKEVIEKLKNTSVTFLNPRRPDWDSTWKPDPKEGPFREQVIWELTSIAKSKVVFFYFAPGTVSPISLLELGLVLGGDMKAIVCCPPDFGRYGNIKITCEIAEVPVYETLDEAIKVLLETIK